MQHSHLLTAVDNTFRAKRRIVSRVIKSNEFLTLTNKQQRQLVYLAQQMERQVEHLKDGLALVNKNYDTIRHSLRKARASGEINVKSFYLHEMTKDTDEELLAQFFADLDQE